MSVILVVKNQFGAKDLGINAATIGLTLFIMIAWAAPISGGCLNPAIGLVQPIFQSTFDQKVVSIGS